MYNTSTAHIYMYVYYIINVNNIVLCCQSTVGLHVRVGLSGSEQCFEYGLGPFQQAVHSQDWTSLTSTEATYPHIRLHQLREEDSLSNFLSTMASIPATMAVILVNSEDSYTLSSKFHSEEQTPPVPMLVVTKETGKKILHLVEDHPRDVQIKIDQLFPEQVEIGGIVTAGVFKAQKYIYLCACTGHIYLKILEISQQLGNTISYLN